MTYDEGITSQVVRKIQELERAKSAVQPYIGDIAMACDSVSDVYTTAMRTLGHKVPRELIGQDAAARSIFNAVKGFSPRRTVAMDAKATASLKERFPDWDRLRKSY